MSGGSKQPPSGYKYFLGMHMGVCQGPIDALLELRAGDRIAWFGNQTTSGQLNITAQNLFGGEDREGGIQGLLDVMMGEPTQTENAYLSSVQGSLQPAYRGFLSLVFQRGLVSINNPYVKPWAMRVKRILAGWDGETWNSAKAAVTVNGIEAMNPAHIVYQCYTDRRWGRGYNAGLLDLASFEAAADTFYNEGMGLCLTWSKQTPIEDFIQEVLNHAGAAVGKDRRTNLVRMRALRGDYDIEDLQVFSPAAGNIVELQNFDRSAPNGVMNELTVQYTDQSTSKNASITVHNLAAIQAQRRTNPATRKYPGCPSAELATRLALRDILTSTSGLARVRFTANRAAYGLLPGDVIAFSWPELNIELMPVRLGRVNYGQYARGIITLEGVQDVFGLPLTTYMLPQNGLWIEPSRTPVASPHVAFFEAPYRELVRTMGFSGANNLDPTSCIFVSVAERAPNVSLNYLLKTKVGLANYAEAATGDWTPTGTLTADLGRTTTTCTIGGGMDLELVEAGQAALIDNEIVRVDNINPTTGILTIARGCADTVCETHLSGARVWFFEAFSANDPTEYVLSEVVEAKVLTRTTEGLLSEGAAPGGSVTMAQRAYRPYPPGRFRINSVAYPATAYARLALSWAHRDRLTQQDQLIDQSEGSIGPEPGTTYNVRIYQQPSTLLDSQTGLSGTSYTFDHSLNADLRVELEAVRGGLVSLQKHLHVVTCQGATLVSNGSFATDTVWSKGAGWSISAGAASKVAGTASDLSQGITLVPGATYLVDFTITSYGTGSIVPALVGGTTVNGTARSAAGTFSEQLVAVTGNDSFHLAADPTFFGTIDNVVVRRIA